MFEEAGTSIGDDLLRPMLELKRYANSKGINVATVDAMDVRETDALVFMDMPAKTNRYFTFALQHHIPLYLLMLESKLIRKENYNLKNHVYFEKIFTYDDSLVDNSKYLKLNYAFTFPSGIPKEFDRKEKLCTLIAGNKRVRHPLELYSKRIEAIRWFEKHHPADFDLYGIGWNEYVFPDIRCIRSLNHFRSLRRLLARHYPSYKGAVEKKRPVLEKYRFAICYENACNIPGYITEKLFDCFFAGCVPVYWGANNVTDHIPRDCFIDKRDFTTYEELYAYMCTMSKEVYLQYIYSIDSFLKSDKAYVFTCDYFAKTVIDQIVDC